MGTHFDSKGMNLGDHFRIAARLVQVADDTNWRSF